MSNDGGVTSQPPLGPAYAVPDELLETQDPQSARRAAVLSLTGLAVSILIAVLTVMPAAFAIGGAGPTFDTLGEVDGERGLQMGRTQRPVTTREMSR